jgi:hypothetical protein
VRPGAQKAALALTALASVALFFPIADAILRPAGGLLDVTGHALGRDFVNVWNGPRLAFAGEVSRLFDVVSYQASLEDAFGAGFPRHNWSYPPHALPLFALFGAPPYLPALALWLGLTMAAFLAVIAAVAPAGQRSVWIALAALSPASLIDVAFGQNGHLTAALTLGAIACLDRRPLLAGVLIGVLTIKPHLGVLIPFALIAIGAWRTIAAAAVTTLALGAMSVALFGWEPWRLYLEVTTGVQAEILTTGPGLFVAMMPTVYQSAKVAFGPLLATPLLAATTIVVAPLAILAFRRAPDAASRALALTVGTMLTLPYAFNYDMVMLAGAIVWWLSTREAPGSDLALLLPAWAAPMLILPLSLFGAPLGPLALAAAFVVAARPAFRGWAHVADKARLA